MGNALGSLSFICSGDSDDDDIPDIKRDLHSIKENHLPHIKEDIVEIKTNLAIIKNDLQHMKTSIQILINR